MNVLLTVEKAAEVLSVSKSTIYRLLKKKALRSFRVGKSIRFSENFLQEFLEEHSQPIEGG